MKLITEDLITSVKRRAMVPTSQQTFQDPDILSILNEDAAVEVTAMVTSIRENFFLTFKRTPVVANKLRYTIAPRAIGNALKDVWYVDSNGVRSHYLPRGDVHGLQTYAPVGKGPYEFILYGDEIMIQPQPTQADGYIEQWYYSRPSRIVKTEKCAKITQIANSNGTTTITVDTDLTADMNTGALIDFVSSVSPFLLWAEDVEISAISSNQIQVATADIQNEASEVEPQVGDYICPAGQTNIPMYPQEYHPVLAQIGAIMLLEAIGDLEKKASAEKRLDRMLSNNFKLISNRVESAVEPIQATRGILDSI